MRYDLTVTQRERLLTLGASADAAKGVYGENPAERDAAFRALEKELSDVNRAGLTELITKDLETPTAMIVGALASWLASEGFTRVETPTVIALEHLDRMSVTEDKPLREQIYRVEKNKCLRPMLAPGLYILMRELRRATGKNVKIFEAGSCFRRETEGARHLSEFTMLNMVEFGDVSEGSQLDSLRCYAAGAMKAVGLDDYRLVTESSVVYGETVDIEYEGLELASGSYGPHSLDPNWGVFEPWVGIGLGIERIAIAKQGGENIKRYSRSTNYLGGYSLRV